MAHTPGKWTVESRIDEGFRVCVGNNTANAIADLDEWNSEEETESNARLIAAAPDLLAALENLFEHCAMIHRQWGENSNASQADIAITQARAAIAKAKGE